MTAKTLMVQGTGSGVGKSVITAALCRWFYRKGLKVAPFKAQNMSLNAYVCEDGGEIGRAQAFQAEACGIAPTVQMNPVLLKPAGDNLSQVILLGRPAHTRNAKDYYKGKPAYLDQVKQALADLRREYDLVILEGAGSPAEINLREMDFVNMAMAKEADAKVLLVGDIDRGGVFAWMKGTYDLLTQDEQDRVAGFLINKFRGDVDLLKPGLKQFEDLVAKPVLGVIPFDHNLFVDEEDSLPFGTYGEMKTDAGLLDVAILRVPRIANFTDFSPLMEDPAVAVRYVWTEAQLGSPDLIVLPGTKNTLEDMRFLKMQGLDRAVHRCHEDGTVVLGICGGFQMMGRELTDPDRIESTAEKIDGLGLLPLTTTMQSKKITRQVRLTTGRSPAFDSGLTVWGYEIHNGVSQVTGSCAALFAKTDAEDADSLGVCDSTGTLIGTYLHGILDNDPLRHALLNRVRQLRNIPPVKEPFDYQQFRERQWDRLAGWLDASIDMKRIEALLET
ncbi:cobyric acid synthase [Nitrospina gracilis]|uniref:cobyric acid synthase n=1 Tax=Nitrospina gracilis TaxID=35801 RepID=UPI001F01674D|nr:cobyric acid synthase [Nitrospina gracilis]MCF8720882.1 adenosylcobyric acid synthase [Nitrospina gracilis Nb-211]